MVVSLTSDKFFIEEDTLLVVLAINNPPLIFSSWSFANCISDISVVLSFFPS